MKRREFLARSAAAGASIAAMGYGATSMADPTTSTQAQADLGALPFNPAAGIVKSEKPDVTCWLQTSLHRVYAASPTLDQRELKLLAARNERLSFQVCVRNTTATAVTAEVEVACDAALTPRVRRVGFVLTANLNTDTEAHELDGIGFVPGLAPDPLMPEPKATIGPHATQPFWVTLFTPPDFKAGDHRLVAKVRIGKEVKAELPVTLCVAARTLQPRKDFPVTHWVFAQCYAMQYKMRAFEEAFWPILEAYTRNMVEHGIDVCGIPVLHFGSHEAVANPAQLLMVKQPQPGKYEFDFEQTLRMIRMAEKCGSRYFEFPHLFSGWGAAKLYTAYESKDDKQVPLWKTPPDGTSPEARQFLSQFLPAFHQFLSREKLLDRSFFHVSDEPGGDEHFRNYKAVRAMLKELAPWMKVMDALSEMRYAKEGITDIPVPTIAHAQEFIKAGVAAWTYFCCGPRGPWLNRLIDTPLAKIRMSGPLFYKTRVKGFLHWGHNYWFQFLTEQLLDPFQHTDGKAWPNIPYGDCFMVYPGDRAPIDSIRYEVFAESLQDYALLQGAGVDPDDKLLADVKGYDEFPKTETWIQGMRQKLLT